MKIENPVAYIKKNFKPEEVAVALRIVLPKTFRASPKQKKLLAGRNGAEQFLGSLPVVTLEKIIAYLKSDRTE